MKSKTIFRFLKKYYLPVFSGILIGTSYIPFPPWAIFFAFIPLWIYWQRQEKLKDIIIGGWITQFTLSLIGFYWVSTVAREHGHLPLPIALLALLFFCATAMYYIPLSGALWFLVQNKKTLSPKNSLLLLASITALIESLYPTLFPWNFGYTWLWAELPGYHLADILGFDGISSVVILTNLFFFWAWILRKNERAALSFFITGLAIILIINLFGYLHKYEMPKPDKIVKALVVQANIGNLEKEYAERGWGFRSQIIEKYISMSQTGIENHKPDFVVWPETSYPTSIGLDLKYGGGRSLYNFTRRYKMPIVFGAYHKNPKTRQNSNSLYSVNEKGELYAPPYKKTHLLAYGEYLPGARWFPVMKKWLPTVADFERGQGPTSLPLLDFKIGPQICYEGLFPDFTRELANKGAHLIVNLTNDSWFGAYSEPKQHLMMTLARAIEVRLPLIRATNTGISTVILPDGSILEQSKVYSESTHTFDIPITKNKKATFYQKFPWLMKIVLLGLILMAIFEKKRTD